MKLPVMPIERVVREGLCSGCGACAAAAPGAIRMVDQPSAGRRPRFERAMDSRERERASAVCPGAGLAHGTRASAWGPVLEVWQGHAADDDVRFRGSSGGVASALAIFAIQSAGMHGVLHTAARDDAPHLNTTVMSTTRGQILARTGSRYAPASPCEGLGEIERAPGACVFIGKPCDVAGAGRLAERSPALRARLGLTVSLFCAGTPTTAGTLEMLREMGVDDPSMLASLRYRGEGWPGAVTARVASGRDRRMSYERAWGEILTRHKQWRCKLCADHTGEFADIAVGDAWHLRDERDPGRSIVVVRTERGRRLLHAAIASGDLVLERVGVRELRASQPGLESTRGAVWGRVLALRMMGRVAPRYRNMPMAWLWASLPWREKARSVVGTWRRARRGAGLERPPCDPSRGVGVLEFKSEPSPRRGARPVAQGVRR